ncbi:PTS system mannitol-specific transporter subunit IIA [Mesomycoplasma conjunctivae]|uniref:Mannitol-specific phosphotransferase enzyme IIA component n=1 Tax=Mesomycoplasma conjunctivae (strain ATCC 25834 / NCTC 10147 / HRC/581) TaxID=572263 RepID=C5J771_MESCH|nr:PTS sugar transporter subunit IIA [Mesomycoplasma conjunctivae]CAT05334.1 PTS system mannitol-specific component IIA [Mesomycoplasma conjunctivae]VEU66559.1 PTS system mannitol-specific transporter subunit IIA [Mesomycoplasma conjunctivae]
MILKKENIFINQSFENKDSVFDFLSIIFVTNRATTIEYKESMIKRDLDSSVAIGNYLALVHGDFQGQKYILENSIIFIHLKDDLIWDNQPIRFVIGLALNNKDQMEYIEKIGLAFFDIDNVNKLLNKANLTKDDVIEFLQ